METEDRPNMGCQVTEWICNESFTLEIGSCVYKLWQGDRYVIVKGKTLAGSIYLIKKGYAGFVAGGKLYKRGQGHEEWEGKNSFYYKFYSYIHKNPNLPSQVEVLLESNDGYELLRMEQYYLDQCIRDKKCLNSNVTAYIPKYNPKNKMYGWISLGKVLAFQKHLKSILPPSPKMP